MGSREQNSFRNYLGNTNGDRVTIGNDATSIHARSLQTHEITRGSQPQVSGTDFVNRRVQEILNDPNDNIVDKKRALLKASNELRIADLPSWVRYIRQKAQQLPEISGHDVVTSVIQHQPDTTSSSSILTSDTGQSIQSSHPGMSFTEMLYSGDSLNLPIQEPIQNFATGNAEASYQTYGNDTVTSSSNASTMEMTQDILQFNISEGLISSIQMRSREEVLHNIDFKKDYLKEIIQSIRDVENNNDEEVRESVAALLEPARSIRDYNNFKVDFQKKDTVLEDNAYRAIVSIAKKFDTLDNHGKVWARQLGIDEANKEAIIKGSGKLGQE